MNDAAFGFAVKPDAQVELRIGAGFYLRMKNLQEFLIRDKTPKQLEEVLAQLKTGTPEPGTWQEQYVTTLIFCQNFEAKVKDSNQYVTVSKEEFERSLAAG